MKKKSTQGGFILLLAALVASLVLILGVSIFELVQKEISLSSLGRDSQFAFYAADTAAECALFWDVRFGYFSSSSPSIQPTCDGVAWKPLLPATGGPDNLPFVTSLVIEDLFNPNGYCAHVFVTKKAGGGTVIQADGFSSPCELIDSSARTLQRSVELRY